MNLVKLARAYYRSLRARRLESYAQSSEDAILSMLLVEVFGIRQPSYLDIGAHDPVQFSNTYLFYRGGSRGVCVEPDPELLARIKLIRPGDTCLNVGVGVGAERQAEFFVLSARTLSTFSREEADAQVRTGQYRIEKTLQIPLVPVNEIITQHFPRGPDFVSLDTEGMDLAILQSVDFEKHRPLALCVETLTHPEERRVVGVVECLAAREYGLYADTYSNSIFVDARAWARRGRGEPLRLRLER
jgi:FkbM family methyltransferase